MSAGLFAAWLPEPAAAGTTPIDGFTPGRAALRPAPKGLAGPGW
jgi:hypothetical protein